MFWHRFSGDLFFHDMGGIMSVIFRWFFLPLALMVVVLLFVTGLTAFIDVLFHAISAL